MKRQSIRELEEIICESYYMAGDSGHKGLEIRLLYALRFLDQFLKKTKGII